MKKTLIGTLMLLALVAVITSFSANAFARSASALSDSISIGAVEQPMYGSSHEDEEVDDHDSHGDKCGDGDEEHDDHEGEDKCGDGHEHEDKCGDGDDAEHKCGEGKCGH